MKTFTRASYRLLLLDLAYRVAFVAGLVTRTVIDWLARLQLAVGEGPYGVASLLSARFWLSHLLVEELARRAEQAGESGQVVAVAPWPWLRALIPFPLDLDPTGPTEPLEEEEVDGYEE